MEKQIEMDIIKCINNRDIEGLVKAAYDIKPYNEEAVQSAKLMADWFDKDKSLNFDKTINRFLSLGDSEHNPLSSYCLYMAAKIYLFNKQDAESALNIVRKAIAQDYCCPGIYFLGAYIYQAGLVGDKPNYTVACNYLIDSCKFPMPWFESYHVLEKKDATIKVKLHYATKVLKYSTLDEFKRPSYQFMVDYYVKNNFLTQLDELFVQFENKTEYYQEITDKMGKALYDLYSYYISRMETEKALEVLNHCVTLGYEKAKETLGIIYFNGLYGNEKNISKAIEIFESLKIYEGGKYLLGYCYEKGIGVEKDYQKAFDIYLKCTKNSFPEALYRLGKAYATGDLKNKDEYATHRYFEEYLEVSKNVSLERKAKIEAYYASFLK